MYGIIIIIILLLLLLLLCARANVLLTSTRARTRRIRHQLFKGVKFTAVRRAATNPVGRTER